MKKQTRTIENILLVLLLCSLIFCAYKLYGIFHEYHKGNSYYDNLQNQSMVKIPLGEISPEQNTSDDNQADKKEDKTVEIPAVDFDLLAKQNADIAAWLYCPDSVINYPVVHKDNEYYLRHLFDGTENKNGTLFVDAACNPGFTDGNTVIHGHHMKSGAMFASLIKYQDQDYYEKHPVMYLITSDKMYQLQIFAGHTVDTNDSAYTLSFSREEEKETWIKEQIECSDFKADIEVTVDDQIVTLSTCAYSFEDARYVLLGKLCEIE